MSEKSTKVICQNYRYGIGFKPLMGYESVPVEDDGKTLYVVTRPNRTSFQVAQGDTVPSIGTVGVDINGNLAVGDYTIPTGLGLTSQFTAKPVNKENTEFALIDAKGKIREKYKLGEYTSKGTLIEQDEFGNLKLGNTTVKVLPILIRTNFQIHKEIPRAEADKFGLFKANRAVFNSYSGKDLTSGTPTFGYFIPRSKFTNGKKLGEFKEVVNGELVTTAELYPAGNNKNIVSLRVRRPDIAYEATALFQEKLEIQNLIKGLSDKSKVARANQESPVQISTDVAARLQGRLSKIEPRLNEISREWESSELYTVSVGKDFLKSLSPKGNENSREPR
jgi:hypothetical protein